MTMIDGNDLSAMLLDNFCLRVVEPAIYSVLPENDSDSAYDTSFGSIYDWVACSPIYNRLVWGYSIKIFPQLAGEALCSCQDGPVLDLGCGSLAFTAQIYDQYTQRPAVLMDRSLKMLRMAKARVMKRNGKVPDNLLFLQADALYLPFKEQSFSTILCENLLHCLGDTRPLLQQTNAILSKNGRMYFTTLVKAGRLADYYLEALAGCGKLVSRTASDHKVIFEKIGLPAKYDIQGNILAIYCQ